jgi:hypothetical protein
MRKIMHNLGTLGNWSCWALLTIETILTRLSVSSPIRRVKARVFWTYFLGVFMTLVQFYGLC